MMTLTIRALVSTTLLFVLLTPELRAADIPPAYRNAVRQTGLPAEIPYAIALTESRRSLGDNRERPWPWTLNIQGKGFFFPTREAALAKLKAVLAAGIRNVDIGLLQINWRAHHDRLKTPENALDPYANLQAGIAILFDEIRATGDLWRAIGQYHSHTPARSARYAARVARNLIGVYSNQLTPNGYASRRGASNITRIASND